jgi:long-chain fatty acid transport protein
MGRIGGRVQAAAASVAALVAIAGEAHAGGFALKERSAKGQGLSFAGVTAGSGGLSSMGFNPAAIGTIDAGGEVAGGLSIVSPIADGEVFVNGVAAGQTVDADELAGVGNLYVGYRMAPDDLFFGLAITTPFGLRTEYEPDFIGRGDGLTSELLSFQISPVFGIEPLPGLTLAVQGNIFYADARLTSAAVGLDGDDTTVGFSAGALWEITDSTTVGVGYDHGYDLELTGQAEGLATRGFVLPATATAELPQTVSVGVTQEITDRIRLMAEAQWQNWSVFDSIDITIRTPLAPVSASDLQDYEDAFFVALGGEYDVTDALTLRAGAAWDETPTPDPDVAAGFFGRTVRVPDEDRIWLSVGGSYDIGEDMTIDAGYSYLFAIEDPEVALRTVPGGTVVYDGGAHIFSLGGSFRF